MSDEVFFDRVLVYDRNKDGWKYVAPHFQILEFACNDGSPVVLLHPLLPEVCELVRVKNGPYMPNSAYRTCAYNAKVGGAANSYHVYGMAVDIPAKGMTAQEIYDYLCGLYPDNMEIGIYDWGVHFAVCPTKKRFRG